MFGFASLAGVTLGRLLSIHEDEAGAPHARTVYLQVGSARFTGGDAHSDDSNVGAPSLPGEVRIPHTVYVRYEMIADDAGGVVAVRPDRGMWRLRGMGGSPNHHFARGRVRRN